MNNIVIILGITFVFILLYMKFIHISKTDLELFVNNNGNQNQTIITLFNDYPEKYLEYQKVTQKYVVGIDDDITKQTIKDYKYNVLSIIVKESENKKIFASYKFNKDLPFNFDCCDTFYINYEFDVNNQEIILNQIQVNDKQIEFEIWYDNFNEY